MRDVTASQLCFRQSDPRSNPLDLHNETLSIMHLSPCAKASVLWRHRARGLPFTMLHRKFETPEIYVVLAVVNSMILTSMLSEHQVFRACSSRFILPCSDSRQMWLHNEHLSIVQEHSCNSFFQISYRPRGAQIVSEETSQQCLRYGGYDRRRDDFKLAGER